MKTRVIDAKLGHSLLEEVGTLVRQGGLAAFPTETVYGLGANALDAAAVAKIFVAKGRPSDNPLIVHVASRAAVNPLVANIPEKAERLMQRFWPGPLTLVLPRSSAVPDVVTCGLDTVGVRMPDHPVALALLRAAGVPIAAPSANRSGRPSPTRAEHVLEDLDGRIEVILDGGPTGIGVESTVLDVSVDPPVLLRPGGISIEQLREVIGDVETDTAPAQSEPTAPRSPGMKYTHYAPKAPLILVEGELADIRGAILEQTREGFAAGKKVGILCCDENRDAYPEAMVVTYGPRANPDAIAASLFHALRSFDHLNVDMILAEGVSDAGLGSAIMNRLRKAASIQKRNQG